MSDRFKMFDPERPDAQLTWDASSYAAFCECPQKYKLRVLDGWTTRDNAIDLEFGTWVHAGLEAFQEAIIGGFTHDQAVAIAVRKVLALSWDVEAGKPKGGAYVDVWRCLGEVKYKNEKGNPAKCPYSHKGKLFIAPGPEMCGCCGGKTETLNQWFPDHKTKHRLNALRAVVWYAEEIKGGSLEVMSLSDADGNHYPLVEVAAHAKPFPGPYTMIMNFDSLKRFGDEAFICDTKTTAATLSPAYFSRFAPNTQVDWYNAMKDIMIYGPDEDNVWRDFGGVVIEAIQVLQSGVRFGFALFRQSTAKRDEFMLDLMQNLARAQQYAKANYWPRNRSACALCGFKKVCNAEPEARPHVLADQYVRSYWNPQRRMQQEERPE